MHMLNRDRSTWPGWARALTTGWLLSPLLVIALLLATFEGYGYYTRHQKTTYAKGGAFGGGGGGGISAAQSHRASQSGRGGSSKHAGSKLVSGGKHVSTLKTGSTQTAATSGNPHSSTPGSSGSSHSTPRSTSPVGHHSHAPKPRPTSTQTPLVTPATGVYTVAVHGSEQAKFGPFSPCHKSFPSRSTIDVHHAAGESPTSYDFDWRLYPGSPNAHDERHIYSYSKNSVLLTFEQETVTCAGIKQSTAVDYKPAQVRVQLPLSVGASWHNHGGNSARTETGTSNVARKSAIKVGNTVYPVYEIVTKLSLAGSETGERDQTWWYSPDLGVPLKFSETLHGKRSGASYSESYTATVIGTP
jgi:hypothetical protein